MTRDLVSKKTRQELREYFVSTSLREIEMAFDAADVSCDRDFDPRTIGQRRSLVEQYYHSLDYAKWADVRKFLKVFENVLVELDNLANSKSSLADYAAGRLKALTRWLEKDGFVLRNGQVVRAAGGPDLADVAHVAARIDLPELERQIDRMRAAAENDPGLAIGTAKEVLETTAKTILEDRDIAPQGDWDLPRLLKEVRERLGLMPEQIAHDAKGAESIRRLLGSLGTLAQSLAELRNLYGTGHGKHGRARGLEPRHARLAVGSAAAAATFLLETHLARPTS